MIFNAQEMEKREMNTPLLIGGATTSKMHTAVKIAPHYSGAIAQVGDASLVVDVCNKLLSDKEKEDYTKKLKENQAALAEKFLQSSDTKLLSYDDINKRKPKIEWDEIKLEKPDKLGLSKWENIPLDQIVPYIDWSPFFWTWEMKGTYPKTVSYTHLRAHET